VGDQDRCADGNENDEQKLEEQVRLQYWKLNALIRAQSKSIAAEPRFHRRAEDSRQHTSTGVDLSAERQEKQSANHAGCEQRKQDVGHSASSDFTVSWIECAYRLRPSLHSQETSRRNRAFVGGLRILGNRRPDWTYRPNAKKSSPPTMPAANSGNKMSGTALPPTHRGLD
jgi:hypothetical protein